MKVGIMQPYFLPYIGYWQLINAVDKYVIYDDAQYIKGGWINRNRIIMNSQPKFINLLMGGASSNKLINEVNAPNNKVYKTKLLKSIKHSYLKAPYFNLVYPIIEEITFCKEEILSLYLKNSIEIITKYLKIDTELILSSNIKKNNELRGQDKVIEICKKLNATEYYNSIGGKELYNTEIFDVNNINLKFLQTDIITYKQFDNDFISNLSIIDVMMFNSKKSIKEMLASFTLER